MPRGRVTTDRLSDKSLSPGGTSGEDMTKDAEMDEDVDEDMDDDTDDAIGPAGLGIKKSQLMDSKMVWPTPLARRMDALMYEHKWWGYARDTKSRIVITKIMEEHEMNKAEPVWRRKWEKKVKDYCTNKRRQWVSEGFLQPVPGSKVEHRFVGVWDEATRQPKQAPNAANYSELMNSLKSSIRGLIMLGKFTEATIAIGAELARGPCPISEDMDEHTSTNGP